jgi:tetratricopeptide (TPR) repeat protein
VKKIIPARTILGIAASFFLANAPSGFAKPQKKPAGSSHENVEPLVSAAMKNMESGVWSVKGTVQAGKTIKIQGLLDGEDFDLTTEPGIRPNTPMREIIIKDKVWICSDGETWHAGQPNDRLIYNWTHVPIMTGGGITQMPFEKVGTEQRDGQTWLHVRMKVPEKNVKPKELPQYWLVLDSQGQAQYIGHTEMPMFSQARKEVMYCSFDYAPAKEKIQPPPLGPPIDDKAYGFNDIEQHKFDWKNKIIRLEVTPRILESKQIGEDTYRGFFKDTATPNHYGVVEFPHDALVKLGFLKKIVGDAHGSEDLEKMGALGRTEGDPVSFYVQVIPIGEKPAARAVAVGAKLIRDADGSVSYTWDTGKTVAEKKEPGGETVDTKSAESSSPSSVATEEGDEDLVNRGIEKAKNGDLDGAIADFDRAAELNPKDDAPYFNRAQAKSLKKDAAGAIADYTRAIELGSTNPAAYNNRGNARAENNDNDGAIADYTRAIELNPNYARAYYNRSVAKQTKGDTAGAKADLKTAKRLDPGLAVKDADAVTVEDLFNRAGAKKAEGDLDGAIADYTRAIQLSPKESAIYNNRGLAKAVKGDPDGAIADFNRALELKPKDPAAYINRGNAKRDKGDLDGAIGDYTRAIKLDPRYTTAYYSRGLAKKQKSDLDGAIADYNRAIQLDPKFARAYCDRGVAKRRKGDLNGAIDDYNRTIELDPKYAIAYGNRANAKGEKGDLDGAIADYTRGIELNPKDSKDYSYRADAHAKKKQYAAAINDEQKAIELDPKNGDYYLDLGWYQLFNRKPREAVAASLKALELSPDDAVVIKANLAHGYLFDNQFEKAKAIYLENKNAKLHDGRAFSQAVLDDFKEFQEAGITHPDMEKIKALLTTKTDAP